MLAEWDAGELGIVQPRGQSRWPLAGLRMLNGWSIMQGEARQRDLVGMTAEAELHHEVFANRLSDIQKERRAGGVEDES